MILYIAILLSDVEDSENSYMYTVTRDNLREHKELLEALDKNEGKWCDTYLKVIDNVCYTNDIDIEEIKNSLDVEYSVNEYRITTTYNYYKTYYYLSI